MALELCQGRGVEHPILHPLAVHRERDPLGSGVGERRGQSPVVEVPRGGAEIDVESDPPGTRRDQLLEHLGMIAPRPWPAVERLQARRIDRHHDQLTRSGPCLQAGAQVHQPAFERL